jgi:hypothetical protein
MPTFDSDDIRTQPTNFARHTSRYASDVQNDDRSIDTSIRRSSETHHQSSGRFRPNFIFHPGKEEVSCLEKWEGYVSEILTDGFRTRLTRYETDFEEIVAEFDFSELADDDRKIICEGIPLVWAITRERKNGSVKRCSVVVLRRQPLNLVPEDTSFAQRLNDWIQAPEATSH